VKADSAQRADKQPMLDPFDTTLLGSGIPNYALDPKSVGDFPPLATVQEIEAMNQFYEEHPSLHKPTTEELKSSNLNNQRSVFYDGKGLEDGFDPNAAWIQTHSGRRFNPINPNPDAIVIQDIAHSLSMQCRFSGHCREFYSVAQHCVLVSHVCGPTDALWGLLHDASEAYLVDVPRPLKRSGKFQAYIDIEHVMQEAICRRFALPFQEPPNVKAADTILLATEARDLMSPLHSDWQQPVEPLPFKIEAWDHNKAKDMFMKRFFQLTTPGDSAKMHYEHYLKYKDQL
jgi:5'-nucleotidase